MDEFLAVMRGAGEAVASGSFTLSLERALAQLDAYRVAEPPLAWLRLVACAVAGGATRIAFERRRGAVVLAYDGQGFSAEELAHMFGHMVMGRQDALAELALGLNSMRGLAGVEMTSSRGARLELDQRHLTVTPVEEPVFENRLVLRRPRRQLKVRDLSNLLKTWCGYCQPRLTLDGVLINRQLPEQAHAVAGCGHLWFGHARRHPSLVERWLGAETESPLTVVHRGVSYSYPAEFHFDDTRAVCYLEGLKLDLTRRAVVSDLGHLIEELKAAEVTLAEPDRLPGLIERLGLQLDDLANWPPALLQAPIKDVYGSFATLGQLVEGFQSCGYLRLTDFQLNHRPMLTRVFPHWIQVTAGLGLQRLPDEDFLIRMPLCDEPGEVALQGVRRLAPMTIWRFGRSFGSSGPAGLVLVRPGRPTSKPEMLGDLYFAL
ncbi:MAG: hypothetical protein KC910_18015, partial [Candidatus Eremiobacteraeota bacterium]|nr:hypothetical protein [Candidatus Eremiobacteraeota bacterium]